MASSILCSDNGLIFLIDLVSYTPIMLCNVGLGPICADIIIAVSRGAQITVNYQTTVLIGYSKAQ